MTAHACAHTVGALPPLCVLVSVLFRSFARLCAPDSSVGGWPFRVRLRFRLVPLWRGVRVAWASRMMTYDVGTGPGVECVSRWSGLFRVSLKLRRQDTDLSPKFRLCASCDSG